MKTAFAIAVLMSATALGGTAYAREMGRMERSTGNIPTAKVHVIYENYNSDEGLPNDESISPSKAVTAEAQSEIHRDPSLRAALAAKDVEMKNVIEIDKHGANTMVYVR